MKKFSMLVNANDKLGHINPEIYGHFSEHLGRCIYEGIYVGEDSDIPNIHGLRKDIIDAFKQIRMPVLRWPGGCFADEYHWMDGIGPKENRKKLINTNWGGVTEDNSFGTHEFMELCELVGCEPYINGNVGSGTVREMSEWIEYMTREDGSPMAELRRANGREKAWKVKYFGVGNENWGCGGMMRPQYYVDKYRDFQAYCKNHSGNHLYKIACGPSGSDYNWMEVLMQNLTPDMASGVDLHNYTVPVWPITDSATEFDADKYYDYVNLAYGMDTLLTRHTEIMNKYDPDGKIKLVLGEWGCWYAVEPGTNPGFLYQQNTMRDAIVAAVELNIFNRHSDRLAMANLAQAVNVLQSVVLTEGDKMIKTPTFHIFDMYKEHQGADAVYCQTENVNVKEGKNTPMVSSSASVKDGRMTITLANVDIDEDCELSISLHGFKAQKVSARILTAEVHTYNTFDNPENVKAQDYSATIADGMVNVSLPACSVVELVVE
ncbi:MAG: alpha-N-arabinofuranosidase [Lachnospiraceae bacterium]|nr:alpha-N-arabinofuranosidase [Lachnospiraceae bacterium]